MEEGKIGGFLKGEWERPIEGLGTHCPRMSNKKACEFWDWVKFQMTRLGEGVYGAGLGGAARRDSRGPGASDLGRDPGNHLKAPGAMLVSSRETALLDIKSETKRTSGRNQ